MQDKEQGFLQDETPLLWKWIGEGIVLLVEDLGTWPDIAEIGGREEEWQREEDWNMEEGESRELMNTWTI